MKGVKLMATKNVTFLEKSVNETHTWLKEIAQEMDYPDEQMAYHALRGVLFALRDRIPIEENCHLASQLPTVIRGIYFDGYHPAHKPEKYRSKDEFLSRVNQELQQVGGEDPDHAAKAVFRVLSRHVSEGEVNQVRQSLPFDI
jgi:uncharacterized protein (DUF2267 family)